MPRPGRASVLVVDDNPVIREAAVRLFRDLGLCVFDAYNGRDALALLAAHPEIAVLFTDVQMPGMDGVSLAERAVAARPGLRVVLTSGYIGHRPRPDFSFVPKPWSVSDLMAAVFGETQREADAYHR